MRNNYKERILDFLNQNNAPVDVEKVRKSCQIANWNTTLKHLLELYSQGAIQGQKTSKGWVFWIYQETHLNIWEEAVGTLDKLEDSETQTTALLTCTYKKQIAISLPKNQLETQKLQKLLGQKIAILKTDIPEKPVIIRTFTAKPVTLKYGCAQGQFRKSFLCAALKGIAFKFALWKSELR